MQPQTKFDSYKERIKLLASFVDEWIVGLEEIPSFSVRRMIQDLESDLNLKNLETNELPLVSLYGLLLEVAGRYEEAIYYHHFVSNRTSHEGGLYNYANALLRGASDNRFVDLIVSSPQSGNLLDCWIPLFSTFYLQLGAEEKQLFCKFLNPSALKQSGQIKTILDLMKQRTRRLHDIPIFQENCKKMIERLEQVDFSIFDALEVFDFLISAHSIQCAATPANENQAVLDINALGQKHDYLLGVVHIKDFPPDFPVHALDEPTHAL